VERTRDVSEDVRREAFRVLAAPQKVPLASLSISHRAAVLHRGLSDRAPRVRDAAILMLDRWLVGAFPQLPKDSCAYRSRPVQPAAEILFAYWVRLT
jgi:predicted kinase